MAEMKKNIKGKTNTKVKAAKKKKNTEQKNFNMKTKKPAIYATGRVYEYKMSPQSARDILKNRSAEDRKKNAQQYLCEYVTEQYGLLGTCVKVLSY